MEIKLNRLRTVRGYLKGYNIRFSGRLYKIKGVKRCAGYCGECTSPLGKVRILVHTAHPAGWCLAVASFQLVEKGTDATNN